MCLPWGVGDNAGEIPGCSIAGCRKHHPCFSKCRCFAEQLRNGNPLRPLSSPTSSTAGGGNFFCPQTGPRGVPLQRPTTAVGISRRREEREGREAQEGKRGWRPIPLPVPHSRTAADSRGRHAYGCGTYGRGQDSHRSAAGPRGRSPGFSPGDAGDKGKVPASRSGGRGGRKISILVGKRSCHSLQGMCGVSGDVPVPTPLSPGPRQAPHQLCHNPEAFGLFHRGSNSHPELPAYAAGEAMPVSLLERCPD